MLAAVVDGDGVSDEIREDRGGAAPGLEDAFLAGFIHFLNPFEQHGLYERTLLYASTHKSESPFAYLPLRRLTMNLSERLCVLRVL